MFPQFILEFSNVVWWLGMPDYDLVVVGGGGQNIIQNFFKNCAAFPAYFFFHLFSKKFSKSLSDTI